MPRRTMKTEEGAGVKRGREELETIKPGLHVKRSKGEVHMDVPESLAKQLADVDSLTYSVAARKKTRSVAPFRVVMTKNGKWRLSSVCAETGKGKSTFLHRKADGAYSGGHVDKLVHAYGSKKYGAGFFGDLWDGIKKVAGDVYDKAVVPNIGRVANFALGKLGVGGSIKKRAGKGQGLVALGRAS